MSLTAGVICLVGGQVVLCAVWWAFRTLCNAGEEAKDRIEPWRYDSRCGQYLPPGGRRHEQ
jgi:hypothetical protein